MAPDERDGGDGTGPLAEGCDQCGRPMEPELYEGDGPLMAVLPDSSAVYEARPQYDGRRMVVVCSAACLRTIKERYRRRPFVPAELWAARITRAVTARPRGITPRDLQRETGLTPAQILAGFDWWEARQGSDPFGESRTG